MSELNWNHTPDEALAEQSPDILNLIESHTKTLRDLLRRYGYYVRLDSVKTDWTRTDVLTPAGLDRIRRNINALQDGFYSLPDWRELAQKFLPDGRETLDAEQVNAKEYDLQALFVWIDRMAAAFCYAGEIYGGERDFV